MAGLLALWFTVASALVGQAAAGVSVATDNPAYAVGDPIQVTIQNGGTDRVSRGGLACDDVWPLALEQQGGDGNWQPVQVPQHGCIGIAAALLLPGRSIARTINLQLDPGTYRLAYPFDDADTGGSQTAYSDPFDVGLTASDLSK